MNLRNSKPIASYSIHRGTAIFQELEVSLAICSLLPVVGEDEVLHALLLTITLAFVHPSSIVEDLIVRS